MTWFGQWFGATAAGGTPPSVSASSPAPDTDPGAAGGFPAVRSLADATPIVLSIASASTIMVTATRGAGAEEIAYLDGFRGAFAAGSAAVGSAYSFLPAGGWSTGVLFRVLAVSADGGVFDATYSWRLPTAAAVAVATPVQAGSLDHLAEMISELPWQAQRLEVDTPARAGGSGAGA